MNLKRLIIPIILLIPAINLPAQKAVVKTITAEIEDFFSPLSESPSQGRQRAIEEAQIKGIADTFGTTITDYTELRDRFSKGSFSGTGLSLTSTDVKGEWVEDIHEPEISVRQTEYGSIYHVKVKFKARAIDREPDPIEIKLLNGTNHERNAVNNIFREGENLYLYFKSPVDGYLIVYIRDDDEDQTMQAVLPYHGQSGEAYPIKADRPYIFFSKADAEPEMAKACRGLKLYSRKSADTNTLFAIFSRTPFSRPSTDENQTAEISATINGNEVNLMPRETKYKNFRQWLSKALSKNVHLQSKEILFEVKK